MISQNLDELEPERNRRGEKSKSCDWLNNLIAGSNLTSTRQIPYELPSLLVCSLHHLLLRPPLPAAMASRRLAFNLHQALRNRAALQAVKKRGYASPVVLPNRTQSTTVGITSEAIARL